MNKDLLKRHIEKYAIDWKRDPDKHAEGWRERQEQVAFFQKYTRDRILSMTEEDLFDYISGLWAMLIWGNKHYVVDKIIDDNGLPTVREQLADLVWGEKSIADRWDTFRSSIKGFGPAMISEILCKNHPDDYMLWSRRVYVAMNYLEVEGLPRYDYQLTGKVYTHLCDVAREISDELAEAGLKDTSLLAADYFMWEELQVVENLTTLFKGKKEAESLPPENTQESTFIHNDIRDKVRDIGLWLGFDAKIEHKVAAGSKVDVVWEATIGNMGRVVYVYEVQTKGSIDSLIVNLLKSLNNPAVQGVVAVSDKEQLEKIKNHAQDVKDLRDKLKYWDYEEVLQVHESLEFVNESINALGLVPEGV